jgi:DNA-binding IclR family transcriptional regulator
VTEIADRLALSKSATHRILVALSNSQMVHQDSSTQRYSIHPKTLELVTHFYEQNDITTLARPFLDRLRDRFRETANLALRVGNSFISVTYSPSPWAIRFIPTIGRPISLHLSAFGKAILAHLAPKSIDAYLRDVELVRMTEGTCIESGQLRKELEEIRQAGFAQSSGEVLLDNVGYAAAIFGDDGYAVGAIGFGGPEYRLRDLDVQEVGRELASTARRLSTAVRLAGLSNPQYALPQLNHAFQGYDPSSPA